MAEVWTTEDVRLAVTAFYIEGDAREEVRASFDQWLAAHDAEVRAATLAPIEALHQLEVITAACAHCKRIWPCPTAQAIADIEAKAGVR